MHAREIIAFCLDGHRAPTLVDDVRWPEAQHQKLVTGQLRCVLGRLLRFFVLGVALSVRSFSASHRQTRRNESYFVARSRYV